MGPAVRASFSAFQRRDKNTSLKLPKLSCGKEQSWSWASEPPTTNSRTRIHEPVGKQGTYEDRQERAPQQNAGTESTLGHTNLWEGDPVAYDTAGHELELNGLQSVSFSLYLSFSLSISFLTFSVSPLVAWEKEVLKTE